ncbi:hypothetical protein JTE90_024164 [Oedothorax gibbosus]|nr:hypothetical protein JTE90_024164 [Oedothorax gibbosus]
MEINDINSGIHSILTLIDVKLPDSIAVLDTPSFNDGDATCEAFQEAIESVYNNPSSALAFSGLSRRIIDMLKAGGEKLPEAIDKVKENIEVLNDEGSVDVEDTFQALEMLHPKIGKEQRRKIVELIVQKDKTKLLKLICNKDREQKRQDGSIIFSSNNIADRQYFWKGELSGFDTIAELLNYAIDQGSSGSVRLLADRIYSTLHPIYNRGQYLDTVLYLRRYSCAFNGESIKSAEEKEEFFKELLEKVIEKGFTDSLLVMLGGDVAQLILKMSKDKFEACDELQDIYNMTKSAVIHVLQSLVQLQDEKEAEKRKALIEKLIEKGVTVVKKKDIAEKDLIALADEHEIKLLLGTGKGYIKDILQKKGVNVSEVKRKLSQDVLYGIIVELFFYQHKQIYAIAEGTNKLIFYDTLKDLPKKGKVKELLSDLEQDEASIKREVLEAITQLNKVGRAKKNFFFRLVFKEIMLVEPDKGKDSEIKVENVEKIIKGCGAICKEPMQKLVDGLREKGVTIREEVMDVLKLVGVDSLALEKSMTSVPENSNVVPSRNIPSLQIEDLTLSSNSGSGKSTLLQITGDIASSSRQPSNDTFRGPPEITEPVEVKAKVLSPVPPGSKAAKEKNKSFMQTSSGQG